MALPRTSRRPLCEALDGAGMLLVFAGATLAMVVAVVAGAILNLWWLLIPVLLVDAGALAALLVAIARLLAEEGEPQP